MTMSGERARRAGYEAARLARLEKALSENPTDRKLLVQVGNAKRRADWAQKFYFESVSAEIDLVNYRIVHFNDQYGIVSVAESLLGFQGSVTAVFDALQNGPKERANYSASVRSMTKLDFGYSYPGSLGFVLSVPSGQDLFGGQLDQTVDAINDFFDISSASSAIDASRSLGLGAISELYKWVKVNANWGNSIDLNWHHSAGRLSGRYIELDRFKYLEQLFAGAEDRTITERVLSGILVGLDVQTKRFHFVEPDGDSIKGRFSDMYASEPKRIPGQYRATFNQIDNRVPATGKRSVEYELLSLTELP